MPDMSQPHSSLPGTSLPAALAAGYRRFRTTRYAAERDRWRDLAETGQRPSALVVACSDSRSAPETVFDAGPGELFVVRNVGALVPPYEPDAHSHAASAALEFAVLALEVEAVLVMGHGRCGGIRAAVDGSPGLTTTDFVGTWVAGVRDLVAAADPAARADPDAFRRVIEHRSVERSIANLRTFPWIAARADSGALRLIGTWFDIAMGELHVLGPDGWARHPED
jgi:carbonic anhydrase